MGFGESNKIRIHSGTKTTKYQEISIVEFKDKNIEVPKSFIQEYDCTYFELVHLSPLARNLIGYLVRLMDTNNEVHFSKPTKLQFIESMPEKVRPTIKGIDNALTELKKRNIIRSIMRSAFHINPIYYTKGASVEKRKEMVKEEYRILYRTNPELFEKNLEAVA